MKIARILVQALGLTRLTGWWQPVQRIRLKAGLVLSRRDEVRIPVISGTSLTEADINALTDVDSALETLYLMRQEIFIAEGRRMMDLGIKWPVPEREVENNVAINPGDPATVAVVPDFLTCK